MSTFQAEIQETIEEVKDFSFRERTEYYDEERANRLLDSILDFKELLNSTTEDVCKIVESFEFLTWAGEPSEANLKQIIELLALTRDLHRTLIKRYVLFNNVLKPRSIAVKDLKTFKESLDDLIEVTDDIEDIYFVFPKMTDFVETTRRLSEL